ncbi:sensor histidine kinase [Streptomyces sp. NP160]|uniref:sensor histidine kinase n=1 Tax=Streptomyces sp. NP160 TaxID=2586637 RepID=UPI0011185DAA|nr:histidine kinase [Streptomyces sp. NP160]TNM64177.1 sensor histidine kinase [Streptomyces sp. NP160]
MPRRTTSGAPPRPAWWRSPRAWWASLSQVQRVEVYTAQVLYWLGAIAPLLLLVLARGSGPAWQTAVVVVVSAAQGLAAFVVLRSGLEPPHAEQRRPGLVALGLTTAALLGLAAATPAAGDLAGSPRQAVVAYTVMFSPAAVAVVHRRAGWLVPLFAGAAVAVSAALSGQEARVVVTTGTATALASAFIVMTLRLSVWLLDVVRQLADAQGDRSRLAVAEERLRFARDLHDVVGRDLSAIALKSEVVARLAERGRPEAVAEALAVRELAQSSLAEVRAVVRGHRRADLLTELAGARALLASAEVACEVRVEDATAAALPAPVQEALAWALREAVTNVVRHGHARTCAVSLAVVGGAAVLVVRNDDGAAPSEGRALRPGAGLSGLRERLEARGGSLDVRRERDRVVLTATVPASPSPVDHPEELGASA